MGNNCRAEPDVGHTEVGCEDEANPDLTDVAMARAESIGQQRHDGAYSSMEPKESMSRTWSFKSGPMTNSERVSASSPDQPRTSMMVAVPQWISRMSALLVANDGDELSEPPSPKIKVSCVGDLVRASKNSIDKANVLEYEAAAAEFDPTESEAVMCHKRSATADGMLQFLAIENPDDINNVYTFDKEVLSKGDGTGISRKGTVKLTGAVRAIKFVPNTLSPQKMAGIQESVAVTSSFDHPNMASLHEVFQDRDYVYLVMTFCPGGTLEMKLKKGTLSEVKAVIVMQQVLRAIFYMHRNKTIHRDVRPSNVLFNSPTDDINSSHLIKIASFGSACRKLRGKIMPKEMGTPGYMAPEMYSDDYGFPVDVWGCGIVMFECLCGRLPFPKTAPPPQQVQVTYLPKDADVSQNARDLIKDLVAGDPKARLSVKQALRHKWLEKGASKLARVPFDASTLANLKTFRNQTPFQVAAYRIIASRLSDAETLNSRKLFLFLDKDGDGNLVPSELEEIIATDETIKKAFPNISEIFAQVDNENNEVHKEKAFTYTEFVAATFSREKCLTDGICKAAFRCFDKNGDGAIVMSELAEGHMLGDLSPEALAKVFRAMDRNMDGKIDFQEFMDMLLNKWDPANEPELDELMQTKIQVRELQETVTDLKKRIAKLEMNGHKKHK